MKTNGVRQMAKRVTAAMREMHDAQQRMAALRLSADRYLASPDTPPDSYGEFLMRTSGPLMHEPPASKRVGR